ncbi:MAG: 2-oxoacid:acceptor oxidoreductase family protein [Candidatus Tectomicrobia bacterium]|uniref:2-oxoacid:acceptor oxidoreductase family protein n=1 Tax=Tectimicrobiota bacterium TaxID=2528274 RepID=A0A933GLA7_UNCTE|nr:2-oxoacid:acceptor oxidoreductase family protein [Candidatus Tectomicrobia bacterium]
MLEIRIHGRGGQGAVIASKILAVAFFKENKYVQAFPAFGVERRGAPVAAFTRIDDQPILLRTSIYHPQHIIVLDQTLLEGIDVTEGLRKGGWVIINAASNDIKLRDSGSFLVARVDASSIALKHGLGTRTAPIVNTAILGSFARVTALIGLDSILEAVSEEVPLNKKSNLDATKEAFEQTSILTDIPPIRNVS